MTEGPGLFVDLEELGVGPGLQVTVDALDVELEAPAPITGVRALDAGARAMLADIPPVFREDPEVQAVLKCSALESARMASAVAWLRRNLFAQTADETGLGWHEDSLELRRNASADPERRRADILAAIRGGAAAGTGAEFEAALVALAGSSASYREHVPGDPTSPPPAVVQVLVPGAEPERLDRIERELRPFLDAHYGLEVVSAAGFILDESRMDETRLGF